MKKQAFPAPYEAPKPELWTGRTTGSGLGIQYWYQQVQLIDLEKKATTNSSPNVGLIGYACDEGVRRNKGRMGAAQGPDAIRKQLARLAFHHKPISISDYGNLSCPANDLEACQNALALVTEQFVSQGTFSLVLGGGHDVSYGHFVGLHNAFQNRRNTRIGILNFDAHFDLRTVENQTHSGTPFNQILTEFTDSTEYFVLGIQEAANTPNLFAIAKEKKVHYLLNDRCETARSDSIISQLHAFVERNDALYITVDLDGFSSAYAPGVSAPSPLGLTPSFAFQILRFLMQTKKVIALDIAELNPVYDRDQCTAILAARIVDAVVGELK